MRRSSPWYRGSERKGFLRGSVLRPVTLEASTAPPEPGIAAKARSLYSCQVSLTCYSLPRSGKSHALATIHCHFTVAGEMPMTDVAIWVFEPEAMSIRDSLRKLQVSSR